MEEEGNCERFADVRRHVGFLEQREVLAEMVESLLGYRVIREAFQESSDGRPPFEEIARRLELTIEVSSVGRKVPEEGPLVFVGNHGHGGADALAMMVLMCRYRRDVKVLASREVRFLKGLDPYVFPVALMTETSAKENMSSLRGMMRHVRDGGCLGVFPAGRVAYWQGDRMCDPPWNDHVVTLLQRMEATIVPVWFHGSPPAAINILSKLSPFLRTALIPTGLAWMRGRSISVSVGTPFPTSDLKSQGEEGVTWLRKQLESASID